MKYHVLHFHENKNMFNCGYQECQKSFEASSDLNRHVQEFHNKLKVSCPFCSKKCAKSNLSRHMKKACKKRNGQEIPRQNDFSSRSDSFSHAENSNSRIIVNLESNIGVTSSSNSLDTVVLYGGSRLKWLLASENFQSD